MPRKKLKTVKAGHGTRNILKLLKENNQGIKLDVGCGENKQAGFVGMDIRPLETVDIVHDVEKTPYPLPDECCNTILTSHLIEHICPKRFISVMNEWWRLMKVGGQLLIGAPYGNSFGYVQDPSHCMAVNEATWAYFDPTAQESRELFNVYKPKPWKTIRNSWSSSGNIEVIMEKMAEVPDVTKNN